VLNVDIIRDSTISIFGSVSKQDINKVEEEKHIKIRKQSERKLSNAAPASAAGHELDKPERSKT